MAIRLVLSVAWGFSALSGFGGVFLTPSTVAEEVGIHLPTISSGLVFVFSLIAAVGVIKDRYELEWVSAWFSAGGASVYVITVWWLVFTGSPTRLQQAASITSLILFYVYRIIACSAHARKQRKIHELTSNTGEVRLPDA